MIISRVREVMTCTTTGRNTPAVDVPLFDIRYEIEEQSVLRYSSIFRFLDELVLTVV